MEQIYKYVYVLVFLSMVSAAAYAQDAQQQGQALFIEKRCYTCHTIKAQAAEIKAAKAAFAEEKGVAPKEKDEKDDAKGGDLSNVGAERDKEWIATYSKDPREYFKDTKACKKSAKKKYRKRFKGSDEDFQVLVTYLSTLKYGDMQEEGFESCIIEE